MAFAATALGQSGERESIPPGEAKDGSRPADGAIKGGTILPGETGGIPDSVKMESRCDELTGTLREECLEAARSAGAGGTGKPAQSPSSDPRKKSPGRAD